MRIALYEPDIAGNVGTILRTAACFGLGVDLIEPMGFPWGDRSMARAGMDYAREVDIVRHVDWDAFRAAARGRVVLATTRGATDLPQVRFDASDILLFGSESSGVPDHVHDAVYVRVRVPMRAGFRSLNVAASAAIMAAEGLRQHGWPLPPAAIIR
ncbi:rRNA methyltransferase [Sphingomonas sp. Leaf17]|uniref:tRNA (cytidine(34)-2'-O)-methyltransferase n=1 Tax=Sphingomonas sp. Leaf17 TaxID=1735683 RepID=UPI0006F68904|nr:TrmH family RNA methyltransferase [Sphingomonas sp. Leaf17]KQM63709.1 rRNA methyltransferase [Sphingomonas sp. Leaf17]